MSSLVIKNLHASVKDVEILKGVNLEIKDGETLALLGPNGHGKSTLLAVIMGNPRYTVTEGEITYEGKDVLAMTPDQRSKIGLFLAMQYPAEIPGLNSADFYKAAMNAHREKPMSLFQFYNSLQTAYKDMGIPFEMSKRNLNEGFSGGEKKRNEILQMVMLSPSLALIDEIDSGLDVDALNVISSVINELKEQGTTFIIISHYDRLYDLVNVNRTAVMVNGKIAIEGDASLAKRISKEGYTFLQKEYGIKITKDEKAANDVSIGTCGVKQIINK